MITKVNLSDLTVKLAPDARLPWLRCVVGVHEQRYEKYPAKLEYSNDTSERQYENSKAKAEKTLTWYFRVLGYGQDKEAAMACARKIANPFGVILL